MARQNIPQALADEKGTKLSLNFPPNKKQRHNLMKTS